MQQEEPHSTDEIVPVTDSNWTVAMLLNGLYQAIVPDEKYIIVNKFFMRMALSIIIPALFLSGLPGCGSNKGYSEDDFQAHYSASQFSSAKSNSEIWLDASSGKIRNRLYVLATGKVTDEVYDLVVEGLEKIIDETGRSVSVMGRESSVSSGYRSPDWYQEHAMLYKEHFHGRQADGGKIIDLLRSHDTGNDHFVVMIIDSDLTTGTEGNNFIFGLSSYPYIVISSIRFMEWKRIRLDGFPEEIYDQAVSILAAHEFGHYLDLVDRDFNCWENTDSILERHCKGENGYCLMQQSNVDVEGCNTLIEQADFIFTRDKWLCPDCSAEVYFRKNTLVEAGFIW